MHTQNCVESKQWVLYILRLCSISANENLRDKKHHAAQNGIFRDKILEISDFKKLTFKYHNENQSWQLASYIMP